MSSATASPAARARWSAAGTDPMLLALGVLACVGLWWLGRSGRPFRWKFATGTIRRVGAWGALALAAILLLRGQIVPALILGLAGAWLLEGPEKPMLRLRRLFQARRTEPRRHRTALVEFVLAGDGSVRASGSPTSSPCSRLAARRIPARWCR